MKKRMVCLLLTSLFSLSACQETEVNYKRVTIAFDTAVTTLLYEDNTDVFTYVNTLANKYDKLFDNFESFEGINNVYTINHTSEPVVIEQELYDGLKEAVSYIEKTDGYFNPFIGNLSNAWKSALAEEKILTNEEITSYIEEMNNTSLVFNDQNLSVQRVGNGTIDLGAFTKGYFLSKISDYFTNTNVLSEYLIDCGSSSILIGEKPKTGYFKVGLRYISTLYMKLEDVSVGTSAIYEQSTTVNEQNYSHIVNPFTGSVQPAYDFITVINKDPVLTDVLSTALMSMPLDMIKTYEKQYDLQLIVSNNCSIIYQSESLGVYEH